MKTVTATHRAHKRKIEELEASQSHGHDEHYHDFMMLVGKGHKGID